jgi:hypothetical protein
LSESGKISTPPRRLAPEVRSRIDAYILRVDSALTQHGATPHQRRSVTSVLRAQIGEKLSPLGDGATVEDVDVVLAQLGTPDSHVVDAARYPRLPTPAGAGSAAVPTAAAAVAPESPAAPAPPTGPPRLSLTALVGAIWSLLFFVMIAATAATHVAEGASAPRWLVFVQVGGWSAPFATTVLGLLSLGRIQRSRGHLFGLSLALFDALLFPLLLLDALIFWICWQIAAQLMAQNSINDAIYRLIREIIPTVASILADYFLVVQAWSAVQPKRLPR